ncbi:MAG: leucine--tRNA ligase [Parachlamydiales bacterium]
MQPGKYHHKKIEKKWQKFWEERATFKAKGEGKKYYVLDMFPYPSGAGLHVGHPIGYTATDILARYKWAKGFDVLHPMGWDSFGLPAEQYAIRTGQHPAITTEANIATYKRQLKMLGLAYDWSREIRTSDPKFYKWTQWIFTQLYKRGLAYEAEMPINYCPALGSVLANEEVENGLSKEGGHPVERRPLKQWVLKITEYAERLLSDLDELDWPQGIKALQRHWIGRSEGATIAFATPAGPIEVFTTCHNTLMGVSYLVLAPEHPLLESLATNPAVADYQTLSRNKSDLDRTELAKEKTGVFTGAYAEHPVTGQPLPIWVADYVLMSYGTGAVMAVPAHDERDHAFALKYNLPLLPVVAPPPETAGCYPAEGIHINSQSGDFDLNGLDTPQAKEKAIWWLEKHSKGRHTVQYRLRDWLFSRQRYWGEPMPLLHLSDGTIRPLELDELPLLPPEVESYKPSSDAQSPLASVPGWVNTTDPISGKPARRETNTMPQWAGSCWYYLRFCDPHNDEAICDDGAQRYWLPVDLYVGGAEHAVLHLLYARFWHKVLYDLGVVHTKEPFPRLFNQGMVTARSYKKSGGLYVSPDDVVERGGEHFHKETNEKLESQIEKMSKSKLNVVNPDEIIEDFGADSLRLYEMFMGPLDREKIWQTDSVNGCRRFLARFYELATSATDTENRDATRLAHRLVHAVENAIETLHFNVAIAKLMEFVNALSKLESPPKSALKLATQALAPFAPHLAEEIWELLGQSPSITHAPWPTVDPHHLVDETVTYVVQVNGKLRGRFDLPKDEDEETIVSLAKEDPNISRHLTGTIQKVIFVPNRLLNFVIP